MNFDEVSKLEFELNKILGHELLELLSIEDGCVEFTFRVSGCTNFSFTEEQQQELRQLKVRSITYGDQSIVISSKQVSHSASDSVNTSKYENHLFSQK